MPRPTVAQIDLNAIDHNMRIIQRVVGPGVKICPAVKADGYGHGAVEVSKSLLSVGADMLGIATTEEAVELRLAGITEPLLILGCITPEEIPEVVPLDVTLTICTLSFAERLSEYARSKGMTARVHIKVDTGMGRIGVAKDEAADFARKTSALPGIRVEGIFTHFPSADEDDLSFTYQQIDDFAKITESLNASHAGPYIRHAASSAATLRVPESRFDMVRPGLAIYGLYEADPDAGFRQALTLQTRIAFLKTIHAGGTVGYGRTFSADRNTVVATIPIGYGDGYNRLLSNRGYALVHGSRVPVIGRICMDQTMLDVTDVPGVSVGDEVVLYGTQENEHISIAEVASMLNTIPYEVACSLGKRVRRVYVRG
jgi:alanine racemase